MDNIEKDDVSDILSKLIKSNLYITNCKKNKNKDPNSLKFIIDYDLSQSECIKLGIGIEKIIIDIITSKTTLKNIKMKNKKGKKERDHLFCNKDDKIIYYAELKSNLNLDTEKSKTTSEKCLAIVEELKEEYPDYEIKWCLLGLRYLNYDCIPATIQNKYDKIKGNLLGINQYFQSLNIDIEFTDITYKKFLNEIVTNMFNL